MSSCPNDDQLLRFFRGELSEDDGAAIEAHIERCPVCEMRLQNLGDTPGASEWKQRLSEPPPPPNLQLPPATSPGFIARLDDFDIEKVLGSGAMGIVYKAWHNQLNRWVAIKIVNPELAALPSFRRLFKRESLMAARVQSDYVVKIHHAASGSEAFSLPYLVMELIQGKSLEDRLRRGNLPVKEAAGIALHIARGLAKIHAAEMIHRDLKPSNILLDKESRRAKIADFGLARAASGLDDRMTRSGSTRGTPAYMSPEHFTKPEDLTPRSDIFSFGVLLYEMLTGERPFKGTTLEALAPQVINDNPVAPRARNREIPVDLETICQKCLDKEAEHRYADGAALAEDLKRFLDHKPIAAKKPTLRRRVRLFARRNGAVLRVAGSIVLLAGIVTAGLFTALTIEKKNSEQASKTFKKEIQKANEVADAQGKVVTAQGVIVKEKTKEAEVEKARQRHVRYLNGVKDAWKAWKDNRLVEARALLNQQLPERNSKLPDNRGVEWYYLDRLLGSSYRTLDFGGRALSARFSPDGTHLAVIGVGYAEKSFCIRIWDRVSVTPERVFLLGPMANDNLVMDDRPFVPHFTSRTGHQGIAFSPDGKCIAGTSISLGPDSRVGMVAVWDADNGRELFSTQEIGIGGQAIVFSPDGKYVIAGGYDYAAFVWEVSTGRLRWTLPAFRGTETQTPPRPGRFEGKGRAVLSLQFSRDGHYLACCGTGRAQHSWPPTARSRQGEGAKFTEPSRLAQDEIEFAFSQDGHWAASARATRSSIRLLYRDTPSAEPKRAPWEVQGRTMQMQCMSLSNVGLAIAEAEGNVCVKRFENLGTTYLRGHKGDTSCVAFNNDATELVAVADGTISIWPVMEETEGPPLHEILAKLINKRRGQSGSSGVRYAGRWQFSSDYGHPKPPGVGTQLTVFDESHFLEQPQMFASPVNYITGVAMSRDGSRLAITGDDPALGNALIRAARNRLDPKITDADLGKHIVIHVIDVATGRALRQLKGLRHAPYRLIFLPDNKRLVSSTGIEDTVTLWDTDTGQEMRRFKRDRYTLSRPEFSANDRWLLASDEVGAVTVWDAKNWQLLDILPGNFRKSTWGFKDNLLALPVVGDRIRIWDLAARRSVLEMSDQAKPIASIAFLSDGRRLITTNSSGEITLWSLEVPGEIFTIGPMSIPTDALPEIVAALESLDPRHAPAGKPPTPDAQAIAQHPPEKGIDAPKPKVDIRRAKILERKPADRSREGAPKATRSIIPEHMPMLISVERAKLYRDMDNERKKQNYVDPVKPAPGMFPKPGETMVGPVPVGTVWKGYRTYTEGQYAPKQVAYELHIREDDGSTRFKGHKFDNGTNQNRVEVEGWVVGEVISWMEANDFAVLVVKGTLKRGEIKLRFRGIYAIGTENAGEGVLTRE